MKENLAIAFLIGTLLALLWVYVKHCNTLKTKCDEQSLMYFRGKCY